MSVDWGAVYRGTYRELVRYLHRKVWDPERAQDLAQEAFTRALSHEPDNPRAWVFRVATNLARDEVRTVIRRKKHLSLLKSESAADPPAVPPPTEAFEHRQRAESLRQALAELSERDRQVLLLWDAGLSYAEIAAQAELSTGAIGTTLARARQRLCDAHDTLEGTHAARG